MEHEKAIEILKNSKYGILSTSSKDNIPYGVAINYFYNEKENAVYFHTKRIGTKINNIKNNSNVSLFILAAEEVIPERYITHYESIIVSGKAYIIIDEKEIREELISLCDKLAPNIVERRQEVIDKYINAVCIVKINIESITGKKNEDY